MKQLCILTILNLFSIGVAFCQQQATNKVPAEVKSAFSVKYPTVQKVEWEREDINVYEAEFMENGQEHSVLFNQLGNWIRTETELKQSQLPVAILKILSTQYSGFKLEEIEKIEDPNKGIYYTFEIEKRKEEYHMSFHENGDLIQKIAD